MRKKIKNVLGQPVVKRMAVYVLTDGLSKAVPFLIMPVIALYLSPSEFGVASNYLVFTQMIGAFIGMNTNSYFSVDYYRTDTTQKPILLSNLIFVNVFFALITFILVAIFTNYLEEFFAIALMWQLLGCLMMLFSSITDMFVVYLRMEEKLRLYSRYQILRSLSSAGFSLLFVVVFLMSWQGRVYALLVTNLLVFILAVVSFHKRGMLTLTIDKVRIKDSLKFGLPLMPHKLSTWIRSGFDRIMITTKVGIQDTGLYSFGANISNAVSLFTTSFFGAYTPYVYKELKAAEDSEGEEHKIKRGIIKKSYMSAIGFAVLLIIADIVLTVFVKLFFNDTYQSSIIYFPFFFIAMFFNFVYNLVSMFVFYSKNTKYLGIITIAVGIIQGALTIPLINKFGTIGASFSLIVGSLLKAITVAYYSQKVYPMPWLFNFKKK
ncbi:oligosaccharide flippase family protein [Flavobacterium salilacus subsp. salilacus]|uniref:lipopolysaccharide biosynthesis protein n=1 Tax=Flavobacterium TaxID=237 RepID=UPI0010751E6B|nr:MULTISPECIES: oligosaccharide flippase family protein [Flavobacterium]KAF2519774.1 oligosaccharide flippase family protein [Flavobacterium salilacus subsp. salilacus]MBE1614329.1 oligosaccharide flippase family protein [Flavobacterium sp. SaA2.13]